MSFSAGSAHGFSFVRRATEADHAALAELFLTTRRHAFPWVPPGEFQLSDFTLQTEGEIIHLADDRQGRPLGFISVWQPTGFIHHLFVHPDCHRQGIGKRLLGSLHDWLPQTWRLKCQTANRAALAF